MQASLKFATEPTRTLDALTATNTSSSFTATTQSTDVDALTHGNVNAAAAAARGGVGEEEMDVNVLRDEIMCDIVDALE